MPSDFWLSHNSNMSIPCRTPDVQDKHVLPHGRTWLSRQELEAGFRRSCPKRALREVPEGPADAPRDVKTRHLGQLEQPEEYTMRQELVRRGYC